MLSHTLDGSPDLAQMGRRGPILHYMQGQEVSLHQGLDNFRYAITFAENGEDAWSMIIVTVSEGGMIEVFAIDRFDADEMLTHTNKHKRTFPDRQK